MAYYYERRNIAFIHIPKTAGTSVCNWMGNNLKGARRLGHKHCDIMEFKEEYHKPKDYFTVVRNPYARLLSWYFYQGQMTKLRINASKWNNLYDKGMIDAFEAGFEKSLDHETYYTDVCMKNQIDYYDSSAKFVLRHETIQEQWIDIQRWFMCYEPLPKDNIGIKGMKIDYKDYYTTKTRKFVEKHFEADLETLKYTF